MGRKTVKNKTHSRTSKKVDINGAKKLGARIILRIDDGLLNVKRSGDKGKTNQDDTG